jgi:hypothetical protein
MHRRLYTTMATAAVPPLQVAELSTTLDLGGGQVTTIVGIHDCCPAPDLDAVVITATTAHVTGVRLLLVPLDGGQAAEFDVPASGHHRMFTGLCSSSTGRIFLADGRNQEVVSLRLERDEHGKLAVVDIATLKLPAHPAGTMVGGVRSSAA